MNPPLQQILEGTRATLAVDQHGVWREDMPPPQVLLPGSFNPLHAGHWGLAEAAAHLTGLPVAFELSIRNVDKPSLPLEEIERRLQQFEGNAPVWVTLAATFFEKAALFPGVLFVVGADTAARLTAARYYDDSAPRMIETLNNIRSLGCRFLVAGRVGPDGQFVGLDDLVMHDEVRYLFTGIPENVFRQDICSTQLRST
jgi:hypothetical protein